MMEVRAHLGQVEGGTLCAVVVVAVHVQDLFALDREEARQDALGQAGA
jgi:hypothetical protein